MKQFYVRENTDSESKNDSFLNYLNKNKNFNKISPQFIESK